MAVTLADAKAYLRVDTEDKSEDELIERLILAARNLVLDVSRQDEKSLEERKAMADPAMYYAIAYLYEHREKADYAELTMMLRAILFGIRKAEF